MKHYQAFIIVIIIAAIFVFQSCANNGSAAKSQMVTQGGASNTVETSGKTRKSPRLITYDEFTKVLADIASDALIVDVRTREEFNAGHIPGAVLFPYDEIDARKDDFARLTGRTDRSIVVYCRSGNRSSIAARSLDKLGYTDIADFGGLGNWKGNIANTPVP